MIEQERIDFIKKNTDLRAYIETATGAKFKKNGKGYMCNCPFPDHTDKTPSFCVTPETNLWNCFGCGKGGDVIRFVELMDGVDFKEAVNRLDHSGHKRIVIKKKPADKAPPLTVKEKKLLDRVVSYYQHTFAEDTRGLDYLKNDRNIRDNKSLTDFGTGFVNGSLLKILPEDEDIRLSLKKIGILTNTGRELFLNCVVFPLYDSNGAVISLYGRNIEESAEVHHLYLPGKRTGLVNRQAAIHSDTLILTESIIDALTLYDQGFKNVMPIYGVNGLTEDHLFSFSRQINEIYLAFDADEAGRKAAETVSMQLKDLDPAQRGKEIAPYIVSLPVKDINIYFKRHTPEEFEYLLRQANPKAVEQSDGIMKRKQTLYRENDHGFTVGYGDRQYQIKGIQRGTTQLKATVKVSKDIEKNVPFELTTIDLYSSRSRIWFAKLCADLFGEPEALMKEDIGNILTLCENHQPKEKETEEVRITKEEKETALTFLRNPNLFDEILSDMETSGVTGEEINKLVGYLAAISRKLDDPLSVLIQSRSAAGKSTLQDAVLSFVPDEDYVKYTRITDQALFYKDEDSLVNKILAIEEEVGMGGAAYSIRNIQSSKKITVATTGKDNSTGKMKTEEYTVKGPVAVMITTTAADVEGETGSRFLFLTIDESSQMTEAIHNKQREAETLEGIIKKKQSEHIIRKHQTAQRLLRPLSVVNPYTQYLTYPNTSLRTRRDHKKYLGLIRVIAYLFQYQRKVKTVKVDGVPLEYIEVTLDDIDKANKLANEVLGQSLDDLARPSRTLLSGIYNMVQEMAVKANTLIEDISFNRRMIREYMNWTDWQIKAHIKQLEELEYLYVQVGSKGRRYTYALNYQGQNEDGSSKCYLNLTPVSEIKKLIKKDKP